MIYPFGDRLTANFAFNTPFGLGTQWPQDWSGQRLAVKTELQTFFFNPTIAYRFSDKFSLGVGASYVISNVTLSYRVPTYASLLPPTPASTLIDAAEVAREVGLRHVYIGNVDHTSLIRLGACWSSGCHTAVHGSNVDPRLRY